MYEKPNQNDGNVRSWKRFWVLWEPRGRVDGFGVPREVKKSDFIII